MLARACRAAHLLRHGPGLRSALPPSARFIHASPTWAKALPVQQLRDEAIRTKLIRIVSSEGDSAKLGPVISRNQGLDSIDRSKNWLMLVDEQELGPEGALDRRLPEKTRIGICKVVNKKEQFHKSKERSTASKQKKQANKKEEKEFQFTWGVAVHDLQHKLKRAQQVLDKGGRAALVITSPKGSKPPPPADRHMFADMLKDQLGLNTGKAIIWKAEEWRGSRSSIYLEGVKQDVRPSGSATQATPV